MKYAIRNPANESMERHIADLLTRPVEKPSDKLVVWYKSFLDQAASWKTARRAVVRFHDMRGTAEGKQTGTRKEGDKEVYEKVLEIVHLQVLP